jgi:hypothetical protein
MSAPAPLCISQRVLYIGLRVRHHDFNGRRVTGVVHGLALDDGRLMVDCALDAPIVIAGDEHHGPIHLHRQYAPAHEFSPFDERDELIAELAEALQRLDRRGRLNDSGCTDEAGNADLRYARAALAKATGGAE